MKAFGCSIVNQNLTEISYPKDVKHCQRIQREIRFLVGFCKFNSSKRNSKCVHVPTDHASCGLKAYKNKCTTLTSMLEHKSDFCCCSTDYCNVSRTFDLVVLMVVIFPGMILS
ncbi:hypothetical protein L596_025273 [Steinernema carpocapsae]|uniref:Uncharacterized protein n=1 Tax=Steinernema carpocapsae TaxID=34508 RepID=A0A4U5M7H4_STECR|nr:hypothetical protein L596_025273 [Steinernema carpocapsae]